MRSSIWRVTGSSKARSGRVLAKSSSRKGWSLSSIALRRSVSSISVTGRENALQGDDEVQDQVGLQIVVRGIPSGQAQGTGRHQAERIGVVIGRRGAGRLGQQGAGRRLHGGGCRGRVQAVVVQRQFLLHQLVSGFSAGLAQGAVAETLAAAGVKRNALLQVGQSKSGCAVAAISGAEDGEQRLVLGDGQQLSIAHGPAF